jgi:peroxin-10
VLGVLLVVQMLVRGYLHIRAQLAPTPADADADAAAITSREERPGGGASADFLLPHVSLDEHAYTSNNELLSGTNLSSTTSSSQRSLAEIGQTTNTPVLPAGRARYDLGGSPQVMGWIKGAQQRKCTLCLEGLKDPAATSCGHVFCWACIGDWVREKPECPLCRRAALAQHILPLRVA